MKALDNIDMSAEGVLKDDYFVSARSLLALSLLINRSEDYFTHKTVNRPFRFILLTRCRRFETPKDIQFNAFFDNYDAKHFFHHSHVGLQFMSSAYRYFVALYIFHRQVQNTDHRSFCFANTESILNIHKS